MHVEIASPTDVETIVALVNDAYRGSSKTPGWTHETALLSGQRTDSATVTTMLKHDESTVLVTRHEGKVVACVGLQCLDGGDWYLSMLAVDPERQAYGVGKGIMAGAERFALERGAQRMKISVINLREPLIAWYERQGYVRTGAVEPFPYDDATVGTALRRDLALITLHKTLSTTA
jgi:ribosomal protein S18 acetylase RimI-like enzyme